MVLVATKCDNPEDVRELDTASVAAAYPSVIANFSTSANSPNTTRECLQVILRAVVATRKGTKACQCVWNAPGNRTASTCITPTVLTRLFR